MSSTSFKVVLLGEGRVGKTCICLRYVKKTFTSNVDTTIQATYLEKRINIGQQAIKLNVWDTAGQERFHSLAPIYYRDADGALLVYDITDKESFNKIKMWVKELRRNVYEHKIIIVIVGNKVDLTSKRRVNAEEAEEYAKSVKAEHILCSAKTGNGVEDAFLAVVKQMMKVKRKRKTTLNLESDDDADGDNCPC